MFIPHLDRRRFLNACGQLAVGGWACSRAEALPVLRAGTAEGNAAPAHSTAYGSGHFGEWTEDQFGLPAYHYTCQQTTDPNAVTPVYLVWRSPTDHTHQVGNDRLVVAASNYGYVQVRQDEGSPKFLNDYLPERSQYGGGIGFLSDGHELLSTYYPGNARSFDRTFGMGYFRKKVTGGHSSIDQVIFAPFGDDPLVISQVTISNHSQHPSEMRWVEYWGCQMYQFSQRSWMQAEMQKESGKAAELRRAFADRFSHQFHKLEGSGGLLETKSFMGRTPEDEKAWQAVLAGLAEGGNNSFNGEFIEPATNMPPEVSMEDLAPAPTFLVSLDAPADGMATNGKAFFGSGGVNRPDGMAGRLDGNLATSGPESALLLERRLHLEPGESRTLYFAYGYLPQGIELNALVDRYGNTLPALWGDSSHKWKSDGMKFSVDSEPWAQREIAWDSYYLRSNLTYDSFFKEHIESQGHVYQYIIGFQGGGEDAMQHTLPFLYTHPWIVKENLRYILKELQPDGRVPYGIVGNGVLQPTRCLKTNDELWVLWVASDYVLGTRDTAFLDEVIPTYPVYGPTAGKETVRNLLARAYHHSVDVTGTGEHGLVRMLNCDWNDNLDMWHRMMPNHPIGEVRSDTESVLMSAMAGYVFDQYARLLNFMGDAEAAKAARQRAEERRQAVRAQWNGKWFRRAWLGTDGGWLGDDHMWLEQQSWAIISGAATPEQIRVLVPTLDEMLRQPSPIGAMGVSKGTPIAISGVDGGVWPSLTSILTWALARVNGPMAWDEWKKNSMARHAEVYPDVWCGIWSGPDNYNSVLSAYPGQTNFDADLLGPHGAEAAKSLKGVNWTDFPVMNMHAHCNQMHSAAKLMGVEFNETGVSLAPVVPLDAYKFDAPLVGIEKSGGNYEGWYAPLVGGTWAVTLRLPAVEAQRLINLEVNGRKQTASSTSDGAIEFKGESSPGKPLRWSLTAQLSA